MSCLPSSPRLSWTGASVAEIGRLLTIGRGQCESIWLRSSISPWMILLVDLPIIALSSMSVAAFYMVAHREAVGSLRGKLLRWK